VKMFYCGFFFGGCGWVGVMVCTGLVGLCVIAQKTKIYPHLRVVKIPYPQNDS
jgi:hypothetical protein